MIAEEQLQNYPNTHMVLDYIRSKYVVFNNTYHFIIESFDDKYLSTCENLITALKIKCHSDLDFKRSMDAFIKYSHEFLILQTKLSRTGHYLYSNYDEVNRNVYQNKDVMGQYYLDGLLLSQVLWPNHYKMGQYFINQKQFTTRSSKMLDVPSGSGIYSYYIAKHFDYKSLCSIDISPFATSFTNSLLRDTALNTGKLSVETKNVYSLSEAEQFDLIVCGELLEHLEQPGELLTKLYRLLNDDGTLFLTTAIYAAAIDHIYLFTNVAEVRALLTQFYHIDSELILPTSFQDYTPDMNKIPINYACVLRKKNGAVS